MKREEAAKLLSNEIGRFMYPPFDLDNAFKMAIKLLNFKLPNKVIADVHMSESASKYCDGWNDCLNVFEQLITEIESEN